MKFVLFEKLAEVQWYEWMLFGVAAAALIGLFVYLLCTRNRPKKRVNVRALTYGAVCICLSFVLSYIKLFSMPTGGSVTLASMLPIMVYSYLYGWKRGILAGFAYGLLQFAQKPEIFHWAQVLIDYPLAFTCIGLAGTVKWLPLGCVIAGFARFVMHTLSGFFFFSDVLDGSALWASALYNGGYMLADTLICFVLSFPVLAVLRRNHIDRSDRSDPPADEAQAA